MSRTSGRETGRWGGGAHDGGTLGGSTAVHLIVHLSACSAGAHQVPRGIQNLNPRLSQVLQQPICRHERGEVVACSGATARGGGGCCHPRAGTRRGATALMFPGSYTGVVGRAVRSVDQRGESALGDSRPTDSSAARKHSGACQHDRQSETVPESLRWALKTLLPCRMCRAPRSPVQIACKRRQALATPLHHRKVPSAAMLACAGGWGLAPLLRPASRAHAVCICIPEQ